MTWPRLLAASVSVLTAATLNVTDSPVNAVDHIRDAGTGRLGLSYNRRRRHWPLANFRAEGELLTLPACRTRPMTRAARCCSN